MAQAISMATMPFRGGDHDSKANAGVFIQFTAFNRPASRYCRPPYVIFFIYNRLTDNAPENKLDVSLSLVQCTDIAPLAGEGHD